MEAPYDISLYPCTGVADGKSGDVVIIAPAYIVTKEDIETIVDRTTKLVEDFFKELGPRDGVRAML